VLQSNCRRRLPPVFRAFALLLACVVPTLAYAGGPANDNWSARQVIATLPATDIEGAIGGATLEPADPVFACRRTAATTGARSIWYSYSTGSDVEYLNVSTANFDALLAVYSGDQADGFELVTGACSDDGGGASGSASLVGVRLEANTEYSIEVATWDASVPATVIQVTFDRARTYAVTKTADTSDLVCDGDCSLREAVRAANQVEGVVLLPAGTYVLTLPGAADDVNLSGDLDLLGATSIYGAGTATTIIDGNAADRVLHLDPAGSGSRSFAITDLTLRNGSAANGGAIANVGNSNPDFVGLSHVRITNSIASGSGGGARLDGFSRIEDSAITGNRASNDGGGVAVDGTVPPRLRIARSTLSGNSSLRVPTGGGGGVYLLGGTHEIDTSTLSGNSARAGGGGVAVIATASLAVRDTTIVDNRSDATDASGLAGGGLYQDSSGAVALANSIVAGNRRGSGSTASDCGRTPAGTLQGQDNFVQVPGACSFTGNNNITGVAAALGPLAANGGPTDTHAPLAGSPVIDTGAASCGRADQRGTKRPTDGDGDTLSECDRGAVEAPDLVLFRDGFE